MCDYEEAIRLDPSIHSPHVCAGLIYLNRWYDSPKAVQFFSSAIKIDPTCARAYLCRAEAYKAQRKVLSTKPVTFSIVLWRIVRYILQYELAISDYTSVIHIEPNNPEYYLYKVRSCLSCKFSMITGILVSNYLSSLFFQSVGLARHKQQSHCHWISTDK